MNDKEWGKWDGETFQSAKDLGEIDRRYRVKLPCGWVIIYIFKDVGDWPPVAIYFVADHNEGLVEIIGY